LIVLSPGLGRTEKTINIKSKKSRVAFGVRIPTTLRYQTPGRPPAQLLAAGEKPAG
jgi:hypothetical protein